MDKLNLLLTSLIAAILISVGVLYSNTFKAPSKKSPQVSFAKFYHTPKSRHLTQTHGQVGKKKEYSMKSPSSLLESSMDQKVAIYENTQAGIHPDEARNAFYEKISDLKYKQDRENEYLKRKVGLDNERIKMIHLKTQMFQKEMKIIKTLENKNLPQAKLAKRLALERHLVWMSHVIGPEYVEEYLHLASR